MIRYERLPSRPQDWDSRILQYATKTLFHHSAWLDHVQSIHPEGRLVYYRILRDGETIGYHCGLRIRKLLIPIHGSPLGGTGTNFMGPLVPADADQLQVVSGLSRLAGPATFLHLELANPWLQRDTMLRAGFHVQDGVTHVVPIPGGEEASWAALHSAARNRVRKAEKNGVVVERMDDPSIADHFYEQFIEVYAKQGMATPFGVARPRSLFAHLFPAGRLLPLVARRDDEILAAGLFPFDERAIYFWGAASWLRHQHLCPNEALQWGVIRFAAEKGIPLYNMCGGTSQFKNKFGGEDVPNPTYYRSSLPFLGAARNLYRRMHFRGLRATRGAPAVDSTQAQEAHAG